MTDVFISYSRRDKEFVARLNEALHDHGKEAWVDWRDIPASADWLSEIEGGIDAAGAFLFVLSPDSITSEVCGQELAHALERRKRILPIVHREIEPARVRPEVGAINWIYLRDQDSFKDGLRTLVMAIDTDLAHVRAHTRLAVEAIDWDRHGRDRGRLLRGAELEEAERWLTSAAAKQPHATELQAQFVQASREAARRRQRTLFGGVSFALVIAVVLTIIALIQRSDAVHQSHVAFSRELDAQAQNQSSSDPELSVLLAARAARISPGGASVEALRQALGRSFVRARYTNRAGAIGDALWSPAGGRLLIAEEGAREARIVRPQTARPAIVLPSPGITSQIGWGANGRLAVTGGARASVWDANSGKLLARPPGMGLAVALSRAGDRLGAAGANGAVQITSIPAARPLGSTPAVPGALPTCLRFSPDGSVVAECLLQTRHGAATGAVRIYSSAGGRLLRTLTVPGPLAGSQIAFSPDSRLLALASSGKDGDVEAPGTFVYDVRTGERRLSFPGAASAVAFSPSGRQLAYATLVGAIAYVYDMGHRTSQPLVGNTGTIKSIAFSPTGAYVITGSQDGTTRVFESYTGTQVELLAGHGGPVTDASMDRGDTQLATASVDGTARIWATPVPRPLDSATVQRGSPKGVALSPDGTRAMLLGPAGTGGLFAVPGLKRLASLTAPAHDAFIGGGWSPDGRWIAALSGLAARSGIVPGRATIYDGHSGRLNGVIAPDSPVVAGAFAAHGDFATASSDGEVDLWTPSGRRIRVLVSAGQPIDSLSFSRDGGVLAVVHSDDTIALLKSSGSRLRTLTGPAPKPQIAGTKLFAPLVAGFSPDGRLLATAGADDTVRLWTVGSGKPLRTFSVGTTPFVSVAFSPDGKMLAAGDAAAAELWNVSSGARLHELQHASASTYGSVIVPGVDGVQVGFTRDGQTLLTRGDFAVRAWNPLTGQSLFDTFAPAGDVSPDGQRVISAVTGRLAEFDCTLCGGLQQLLADAVHNTTRGLTPGETALYLHQS